MLLVDSARLDTESIKATCINSSIAVAVYCPTSDPPVCALAHICDVAMVQPSLTEMLTVCSRRGCKGTIEIHVAGGAQMEIVHEVRDILMIELFILYKDVWMKHGVEDYFEMLIRMAARNTAFPSALMFGCHVLPTSAIHGMMHIRVQSNVAEQYYTRVATRVLHALQKQFPDHIKRMFSECVTGYTPLHEKCYEILKELKETLSARDGPWTSFTLTPHNMYDYIRLFVFILNRH